MDFRDRIARLQSQDPATVQRHQLLNLILLFAIGKLLLNLPITWLETALIVGFAVAFDHLLILIRHHRLDFFSYSSINTALGVAFLLRSVEFEIYLFVIALALLQKHWLRINNHHFLNPSNVAVVAGLMLFPYATYTTPGQWGSMWWLGIIMTLLGLIITLRVGRVLIPLTFSVSYAALIYLLITHSKTEIIYTLVSGSFLLFIYFMLTDPRTTPDQPRYQILYALTIAILSVVLELILGAREITLFLALFLVSLFVPLMRVGQRKPAHTWGMTLGGVSAAVLVIYLSPLNTLSHLEVTAAPAPVQHIAVQPHPEPPTLGNAPVAIDWNQRPEWYETTWNKPHVVATPYTPQPRGKGFIQRPEPFPGVQPSVQRRFLGMDYAYHAPIASGDINHDGKLDLAIGSLGQPLTLWINRGDGTFVNATRQLIQGDIPLMVDQIVLADVNSDSYLDLVVLLNPYAPGVQHPNRLYLFDPQSKRFVLKTSFPDSVAGVSGGIALTDINQDRLLDIYLSFAHDWSNPDFPPMEFMQSRGVPNQFWVSASDGWHERKTEFFPQPFESHAGMTAMFTDLNDDGRPDFLLGNDMQPDLSYRMGADGRFELIPKEQIEYNSDSSMSYLGADLDNDGTLEIWEDCISNDVLERHTRYGLYFENAFGLTSDEDRFRALLDGAWAGKESCDRYPAGIWRNVCEETHAYIKAVRLGNPALCDAVQDLQRRSNCYYDVDDNRHHLPNPENFKADVERFPRKIDKNVLLKWDASEGRYRDVLGTSGPALTRWSWAAYPFDLNNNGYQDLFITTGMSVEQGEDPDALLMNFSHPGKPELINQAKIYKTAFKEDGRGVVAADLDGDGDGELVINNLYAPPIYLENHFGGSGIDVSLRSRRANYYAIGSRIELHTNRGVQVREMAVGGIWDSAQPMVQHFGLAKGETIEKLVVRWPYGATTAYPGIEANHHYVIYD